MIRWHPILQNLWKRQGLCIPRHPALESRTRCKFLCYFLKSQSRWAAYHTNICVRIHRWMRLTWLSFQSYNSSSSPNITAQNSWISLMSIWLSFWYVYLKISNVTRTRRGIGRLYVTKEQNAYLGSHPPPPQSPPLFKELALLTRALEI